MSLQHILPKLPLVREWMERTLAAHRENARSAASYRFSRLAQFYPAVFLETAFVVLVPKVPLPPLTSFGLDELAEFEQGDYAAVTYRNTYFVRENSVYNESLHFHELVHVVQWQQLGVDGFLTAYAAGLLEHGYRNSPLEAMAFDLQAQFDQGGPAIDVKAQVRSRLKAIKPF